MSDTTSNTPLLDALIARAAELVKSERPAILATGQPEPMDAYYGVMEAYEEQIGSDDDKANDLLQELRRHRHNWVVWSADGDITCRSFADMVRALLSANLHGIGMKIPRLVVTAVGHGYEAHVEASHRRAEAAYEVEIRRD